jgi:isopenicillin N synthase-like dioxygenase
MTCCQKEQGESLRAVTISFNDLKSENDLSTQIEEAFGFDGLGLIVIRDYPEFQEKREKILRAIRQFALLSDDTKEKYAVPQAHYSIGWSHGKEKMKNGIPDFAKGSYYARPHADVITEDENLKSEFPETYMDNVWPKTECPELEHAFKDMTKVQIDLGLHMCKLFDRYLHQQTNGKHKMGQFYDMLKDSVAYKGRMLHYFPVKPELNSSIDGLCGWHLDHGCITCLLSPLYLDLEGNNLPKPEKCGLYVKSPRNGSVNKVDIPADCLVIQLGEFFQILSGGLLRATPHCVRSSKSLNITREQLAVFMDCPPTQALELPEFSLPREEVFNTPFLPDGVPELKSRIVGADTYRDFAKNTFKAYLQ